MELTLEQRATNAETSKHIMRVQHHLHGIIHGLLRRAEDHDACKLAPPEVDIFTEFTPKLATTEYDTGEYRGFLKAMKPALDHHYANSRHHPEHFKNGVEDMNLLDIIEMFCDWKAATERQHNGNLRQSIEKNADRFKISPQLVKIFENSIELFDKS